MTRGTLITIPFSDRFSGRLLDGTKTMTARNTRYGNPGDSFYAFGARFVLTKVERAELGVAKANWKDEGCDSPEHFVQVWKELHPRRPFDPTHRVWLHHFERAPVQPGRSG